MHCEMIKKFLRLISEQMLISQWALHSRDSQQPQIHARITKNLQDVLLFSFNKSGACYYYRLQLAVFLLFFSSSLSGKVKQFHYSSVQTLRVPGVRAPRLKNSRHMKMVRLPALRNGRRYPQEIFVVLISVRG